MTSYSIGSHNSGLSTNILMAEVKGTSGEAKLSIKPIEQYFILYAESLIDNTENDLDLSSLDFSYIIKSLFWSNPGSGSDFYGALILRIKDAENNLLTKYFMEAEGDAGVGFGLYPFPFHKNWKVTIEPTFPIDKLTLMCEPVLILEEIKV